MKSPTILVIPDVHCHPDYHNRRLEWANQVIRDTRPTHLVCLGDFIDLASLASYDRGKLSFEGRRLKHDLASAQDGMGKLLHKVRGPVRKFITGNHEDRADRLASERPELAGFVSGAGMPFLAGWGVVPYKSVYTLAGINFTHCIFTALGKPVGGKTLGASVLRDGMESTVVGHSHIRDECVRTTRSGRKVLGLSAGCLVHPLYGRQQWAVGASHEWWSGLTLLRNVRRGWPEEIRYLEYR